MGPYGVYTYSTKVFVPEYVQTVQAHLDTVITRNRQLLRIEGQLRK